MPRLLISLMVSGLLSSVGHAAKPPLATAEAHGLGTVGMISYDGMIEAVRQTVVAAQIAGAIVAIDVKPGDRVRAGQTLLRIDARVASQTAAASEAQMQATQASFEVATKELERQRQLFEKRYISQTALDRAEAQFKLAQAQARAQAATAAAARTQSSFFTLRAPYTGIIAKVPVVVGDMALPGRSLLTLYDPGALRVTAALPHSDGTSAIEKASASIRIELPGQNGDSRWLTPTRVQLLPTLDAATHTAELRLDLPATTAATVVPGMFTRVWLQEATAPATTGIRLFIPARALVRRAEMTGLYVVDASGQPRLRQVRPGRKINGDIEILAGLNAGEKVALDPEAATRLSRH